MKHFEFYGFNDFIICAGYKQYKIKEFFANYFFYTSDITFDFTEKKNGIKVLKSSSESWRVTVVDTGLETMTGGRVKRVRDYIGDEPFLLTYGDGVSDINLDNLLAFHHSHGKKITISAYNKGQRFGVLDVDRAGKVRSFKEKISGDGNLVNIGYMVCQPEFIDYIEGDTTALEKEPLERAVEDGELMAYKHTGFWCIFLSIFVGFSQISDGAF